MSQKGDPVQRSDLGLPASRSVRNTFMSFLYPCSVVIRCSSPSGQRYSPIHILSADHAVSRCLQFSGYPSRFSLFSSFSSLSKQIKSYLLTIEILTPFLPACTV